MRYIEIKAPAKINIGINVLEKRNDGYHNINTLFYPIYDLYDTLTFELSNSFEFSTNSNELNIDDNLIVNAKLLLEKFTERKLNVKIFLEKKIPIGAGLGGGSSDAAATLISLNELFNLSLQYDQLINLAFELGSDIPFFIKSKPAIGKSRGELLEHIDISIDKPILIINPGIHISSKKAYQNIKPIKREFDYKSILIQNKLDYIHLRKVIKNDFEDYVFSKFPEVGEIKKILYEKGAVFAQMSGSGSSVYGFFNSYEEAENAIKYFPAYYFHWISSYQD